jgi:hypothetical protein
MPVPAEFGMTIPVVTGIQPVVTGIQPVVTGKKREGLLVVDTMAISACSRRIGVDIGVMITWKII